MNNELWDTYERTVQEVLHLPEGSSQQADAAARCKHLADEIKKAR